MTCDECNRRMNYAFRLNGEDWKKAIGEEKFRKNIGYLCAHCALERIGGLDWYIIVNEPLRRIRENIESCASEQATASASAPISDDPSKG